MTTLKGTILVTGANGGLGASIVSQILLDRSLSQNYHGLYTVRSPERANSVSKVLTQKSASAAHTYDLVALDLSSLASVRKVAEDVSWRVAAGEIPRIRALVLCAGWQEYTTQTWTDDGFDMAFQTNYLGHFLLTLLLLGSMDKGEGRVVVLGSWSHDTADERGHIGPVGKAYQRDGYQTIFCTDPWNGEDIAKGRWSSVEKHPDDLEAGFRRRDLARRISADPSLSHISVVGLDPGAMPSGLGQHAPMMLKTIFKVVMPLVNPVMGMLQPNGTLRTTAKSAADTIRACFDTKTLGQRPNGVYMDGSKVGDVGAEAKDQGNCERLWRESLGWAGVVEGDTVLGDMTADDNEKTAKM
ncbi:hypothetical protein BJ170DRAFT_591456 [Xylariales sp. AK1849]|nr:hypothetical protein BJ170DRAFT_591456 [Xylariales sp. AK1849]